jgi:hypothetical protein
VSTAASILTSVLGVGTLAGLGTLLRLRTDKDATTVDTVSKGVMVLDRLNTILEQDLADVRAELVAEKAARLAAETERDELRRQQGYPTQPGEQR